MAPCNARASPSTSFLTPKLSPLVYCVIIKRKENHYTCFEEGEGSVLFRGPNRENLPPSPIVSSRAPGRIVPNTSGRCIDWVAVEQVQMADAIRALLTTDPWELFFGIIEPTYLELTMELCSTFHLQTVMTSSHDYKEAREHWCRQYPRRLLLIVHHQTERHRKGVISIGPYVTRLARHFGLLNTAAQESSLTLIGQMSPQGISSMLSMRMIERHRGTYPHSIVLPNLLRRRPMRTFLMMSPHSTRTHRLSHHHPLMWQLHMLTSLSRFDHQFFQRFDNIDATLQQICQHLHISSPVPPREPSSDEDV
ncbi:hypothetical protein GOBAR_AA40273 [Gossypium barbadense]|uniref:Uncharacterized protein n=1 Tax=Gossypium barbadense TaxID=3634 RepID=A0A2P5VNM3_GOSBA|nr:hypothetical protein GOBAR_AA40273 [Gossypium barbadense]